MISLSNKRGELTTQQIIILIILILSFAVILYFIFSLNLGEESDNEICRNSVVLRANSVLGADSVPLDCRRQYVCITEDGSCEKMTSPKIIEVKTKDDVYQALADELAECWWMFGEGKLNYAESDLTGTLYCSICSQIAFDDSVEKEIFKSKEIDEKTVYDYMSRHNYSSGKSYLKYIFGTNNLEAISQGNDLGKINLGSQYYSLMGVTSEVSNLKWVGIGVLSAGALVLSPFTGGTSLGSFVGILSLAGGGAAGGLVVAPVIEGANGDEFIPPTLIEAGSPEFRALNCEEITTKS